MTNFRRVKPAFLFALILLMLATGVWAPARTFTSGAILALISPFSRTLLLMEQFVAAPVEWLRTQQSLVEENNRLRDDLGSAREARTILAAEENDANDLRAALGYNKSVTNGAPLLNLSHLGAHPHLALPLSSPNDYYDTFVIDQGARAGVRTGQLVFSLGGGALGSVDMAISNQARVTLFSAPGIQTLALVGPKHLREIVHGSGNGNFKVDVPHTADVNVGDTVELAGAQPWVIGTVGAVESAPASAFTSVLIKSLVNVRELKWVLVSDAVLARPDSSLSNYASTTQSQN